MKNITNMTNKLWTWVKLSVFTFPLFVSCSQEECLPQETTTLQFVVSDFPAFSEDPDTRAIGTQDAGKTEWADGDEILVTLSSSQKYGTQTAAITYDGDKWTMDGSLQYLENETPTFSAIYAPCYEVTDNTMNMKAGVQLGMMEYLVATDCTLANGIISISFEGVTRDYSRLRMAGVAGQNYTVTTSENGFTPAGATTAGEYTYTLTADDKGNAYLYGTFAKDATVTVKQGETEAGNHTFTAATEAGMSYALDARVAQVTEEYIEALVQTLKDNADNNTSTDIIGNAMITVDGENKTAIGEAIYRLSEDENYYGKIDLILQDATEIIDQEFAWAYALKSITLPKVTKLGDQAFACCEYLTKITFGSVVTEGIEYSSEVFRDVGYAVGGCDLFLNCEQANAEANYQPNIETKTWWNTEWKSITFK